MKTKKKDADIDKLNKRIGEAISKCLKYRKISQKELAKKLNVSESTVSQWIKGNNTVPGNYLFIISSILDLELSHFYSAQNYFSYPELKRDGKYEDFVSTNITNMEEYLNEAIREIKTFTIVENSTLTQNDVFLIENIIKSIINYVKDSEIKEDK